MQELGGFKGVNHLEFRLRDTSTSAAQATVAAVRSFLAQPAQPDRVFRPAHHPRSGGLAGQVASSTNESKVLDILTVLAVISAAFLLANTIRTMIAEQTGEIGVMRAMGASRRDIRRTYLRTAALLGAAGAVIGVPLGMALAYVLVGLFGRMVFGVSPASGIDWPVAAHQCRGGCGRVSADGRLTLRRALRTPVREALNSEGLVSGFGDSRLDRAIAALQCPTAAAAHRGTQRCPPERTQPHDHRAGGPGCRHPARLGLPRAGGLPGDRPVLERARLRHHPDRPDGRARSTAARSWTPWRPSPGWPASRRSMSRR